MTDPVYTTADLYLAAFLCHKSATMLGLRRLGPKKVETRFAADRDLHHLLRLYWGAHPTPVIPSELFRCLRTLKNSSINRYE